MLRAQNCQIASVLAVFPLGPIQRSDNGTLSGPQSHPIRLRSYLITHIGFEAQELISLPICFDCPPICPPLVGATI